MINPSRLFVALSLACLTPLGAQQFHTPLPVRSDGYVTDAANILRHSGVVQINAELAQLQKETGAKVALVTLDLDKSENPSVVAQDIGQHWGVLGGLSSARSNLGAVILLTPKTATAQMSCHIAASPGAQRTLTASTATRLCETSRLAMVQGNYIKAAMAVAGGVTVRMRAAASVWGRVSPILWPDGVWMTLLALGVSVLILMAIFAPGLLFLLAGITYMETSHGDAGLFWPWYVSFGGWGEGSGTRARNTGKKKGGQEDK